MNNFFSSRKKNKGETLLEVLIATVVLVIVLTTTFSLLSRGIATNINVKNRIIAINIAREGIESVRNIRDTNWLKYSGDRRGKWLCLEGIDWENSPHSILEDCYNGGAAGNIHAGFYAVDLSENLKRYFLQDVGGMRLNLSDDLQNWEDFQIHKDGITDRFTHHPTNGIPTPFYRQIDITPASSDTCGAGCQEEKIKVTSFVQWKEVEDTKEVVLETHLYDFYERDDY